MEAAETELGQGIGVRLRRAREERGLSLEECAERLYLPATVLQALESEQFAALGAGVYARGHLRRYAGLLELDATSLEQLMLQRLAAAPDLANIVTRRVGNTRPRRRLGLVPVAIVAAVLAIAVLVWWSARHAGETAPQPIPVTTPATGRAPVAPVSALVAAVPAPAGGAPLVVAEAGPRMRPVPSMGTAPATPGTVSSSAVPKAGGATTAPRRREQPQPQPVQPAPQPPRETQRDYMNFDF